MGPSKEKKEALQQKMDKLGIKNSDIELKFIKASGRGGQKVNKSNSAVFVKHTPTGITAKCGKDRSQTLNRFLATRSLVEKIEANDLGKNDTESAKIIKLRKQKARRKRKSQKKHIKGE